jgi:hypothetical protein
MASQDRVAATSAAVADVATAEGVLRLDQITVIGIFGPESALQALIRMPGGSVRRIGPGARIDRATVASIDMQGIVLQQAGRTRRLDLPEG